MGNPAIDKLQNLNFLIIARRKNSQLTLLKPFSALSDRIKRCLRFENCMHTQRYRPALFAGMGIRMHVFSHHCLRFKY